MTMITGDGSNIIMHGNEDNNSSAVVCDYRNGIDEIGNNNGIIMPLKIQQQQHRLARATAPMNVNENNEDDNKTHYRQQQQNDTKNKDKQLMKQEGKNATPGNTQEINLDNSNDGDDNQNTHVSDD